MRKAGSAVLKKAGKKGPKSKSVTEPSDADVQLRAYFIAERRMQLSLPGDSAHDWLEAKHQLVAEAQERARTAQA